MHFEIAGYPRHVRVACFPAFLFTACCEAYCASAVPAGPGACEGRGGCDAPRAVAQGDRGRAGSELAQQDGHL